MNIDITNDVLKTLKIGDFYKTKQDLLPNLPKLPEENVLIEDDDWNTIDISYNENFVIPGMVQTLNSPATSTPPIPPPEIGMICLLIML